jgi:hypothetical protein
MRAAHFAIALLAATAAAAAPVAPAPKSGVCGDGLLEAGEDCKQCAADCTVKACEPGAAKAAFSIALSAPEEQTPSTAVVRIAYRSDLLMLPGSGSDPALRNRIRGTSESPVSVFNDLDYAVRVVLARPKQLALGDLFTVEFDACRGARIPTAADVACVVEACANANGAITGCECRVREAHG